MEERLFYSAKVPGKRRKTLMGGGALELILGAALMGLSTMIRRGSGIFALGMVALAFGIGMIVYSKYEKPEKYSFSIYTNHIEGRVTLGGYVSVDFTDIYNVNSTQLAGNEMLLIETSTTRYVFSFENVDEAYRIINKKLDKLEQIEEKEN